MGHNAEERIDPLGLTEAEANEFSRLLEAFQMLGAVLNRNGMITIVDEIASRALGLLRGLRGVSLERIDLELPAEVLAELRAEVAAEHYQRDALELAEGAQVEELWRRALDGDVASALELERRAIDARRRQELAESSAACLEPCGLPGCCWCGYSGREMH